MSGLSWVITTPFWLEDLKKSQLQIYTSEPISHFGCRRYLVWFGSPEEEARIREREIAPLSYVSGIEREDVASYKIGLILAAYLKAKTGIEVSKVINRDGAFWPLDRNGVHFYVDTARAAYLNLEIDSIPAGYELYSSSDLIRDQTQDHSIFWTKIPPLTLIKTGGYPSPIPIHEVEGWVAARWETGTIPIKQSVFWSGKITLAKEFMRLWPDAGSVSDGAATSSDQDADARVAQVIHSEWLGCEFKTWLEKALLDLVQDKVPTTRVSWGSVAQLEKLPATQEAATGDLLVKVYSKLELTQVLDEITIRSQTERGEEGIPGLSFDGPKVPIMVGEIGYDGDDTWFVTMDDGRTQEILAIYKLEGDPPHLEPYLARLKQRWVDGHYVTAWGHYLYRTQGIISSHFVRPYQKYTSLAHFRSFLGLVKQK